MSSAHTVAELLEEYERALAYTDALWLDLDRDELTWRPHELSSAIGWHVGHQAAVAHFMVRNLTAAEARLDPELDALMDSATPEPERGSAARPCPADRVPLPRRRSGPIPDDRHPRRQRRRPEQLAVIATGLLTGVVNHEYQHDRWIGEVRAERLGRPLPQPPTSSRLGELDGYVVIRPG